MKRGEPQLPDQGAAKSTSFDTTALEPIHELNSLLLELLADATQRPSSEMRSGLVSAIKEPLVRLAPEARKRSARSPVCLVDAGFKEQARWGAVADRTDDRIPVQALAFPHLQAIQLAHETLMLAWTMARASPESACIVFGMTRTCVSSIARLTIQTIQRTAERHPDWIRPRWENDPAIWRHLLHMAAQEEQPRLPPIGIRALQRQLADLEPATGESSEIRSTRR
jgi:hypothetical protein